MTDAAADLSKDLPKDLRYTKSHEWVRQLANGQLEVGITDHAQSALGDLVFVDVPVAGARVAAGEACAVVESVKAASDIYSPVDGVVALSNLALAERPELLNQSPYEDGWLMRIDLAAGASLPALLDAAAYANYLADEAA
jgi:glycine cleavage system H protein